MKKIVLFLVIFCCGSSVSAQVQDSMRVRELSSDLLQFDSEYIPVWQYWQEHNIFQHLNASISLGTTGVGIDLSSPIGDFFQLRVGASVMPKFDYPMSFGVQVGDSPESSDSKIERLSEMMESFTGYKIDKRVDMIGEPNLLNTHVLIDVFPFKRKNWHFTAGLYFGTSKVAYAYNTTEDMSSLLALSMYNKMYEKAIVYQPIIDFGRYRLDDPDILDMLHESFQNYGRMGIHIGDYINDIYNENLELVHAKGDPYRIEPDEDGMVKVRVKTNALRPYLGFGYGGRLIKGSDAYSISFDCGAMFWGGTPKILTHDGTDLAQDVENIGGKVGTYVDLLKTFKVYPVLNLRFSCRLF